MDIYAKIALKIIQDQEGVIGPIALEQAKKVSGLTVDWSKHEVALSGNASQVLDELVNQYKHLFGQASVNVCREAAKEYISELPKDKQPTFLS